MSGSTDSNWIFDPSGIQNDSGKPYLIEPTEKYNFMAEGMQSGGSDSIHENFSRLKGKQAGKSMNIMMPNSGGRQDIIHRAQMSVSPKMSYDGDRFLFQAKKGNISSMSGIVSREDNMNPLLFSINENLSANRRKPKKSKLEEEIIDELFSNKRDPTRYSNMSNLSAVRSQKPKKVKNRRRRSAFKGINPQQVFAELSQMRTEQRERKDLQSQIIDNSCQITKKGKEDIEKMVKLHKTKTSMIYSEINSANTEDELADTVKPLDFKEADSESELLERRKLTFGMKVPMRQFGRGLDMDQLQKEFLNNSQLREEIQKGILENFNESKVKMNQSEIPKMQTKKKKKKKKKTGSMRVIKTQKAKKKKPPKLTSKRKNSTKNNIKKSKKTNKTKGGQIKKKKNVGSKPNLHKVISRYGIPLLTDAGQSEKKVNSKSQVQMSKSRMKKRGSKVSIRNKKRHSVLMNTTLEAELNNNVNSKQTGKYGKSKGTCNTSFVTICLLFFTHLSIQLLTNR
jgi:hypothetical protein